jgi:hypothetical protein
LIEGRIASDLKQNLEAIREYVESKAQERTKLKAVLIPSPAIVSPD